jgi:hypothetical protein
MANFIDAVDFRFLCDSPDLEKVVTAHASLTFCADREATQVRFNTTP